MTDQNKADCYIKWGSMKTSSYDLLYRERYVAYSVKKHYQFTGGVLRYEELYGEITQ